MERRWQPSGWIGGAAAREAVRSGAARPLAGNRDLAFDSCEDLSSGQRVGWRDIPSDVIAALSRERVWGSIPSNDGPVVMGIVNVTPDSFFDGGAHDGIEAAIEHGRRLHEQGARIVDVGGESTRPGAVEVDEAEELRRTVAVVEVLAGAGIRVSIDSRKARVMERCLEAGAAIINDVQALRGPGALEAAAASKAAVVLMHMARTPRTMQRDPRYDDVVEDVYSHLHERIEACVAAGIGAERIAVDPGIGFGKTVEHNRQLLSGIARFHGLGCPILVGVSRKGFIAALGDGVGPQDRLPGSLAAALYCLSRGVQVLRVHDVAPTRQAISVWQALSR